MGPEDHACTVCWISTNIPRPRWRGAGECFARQRSFFWVNAMLHQHPPPSLARRRGMFCTTALFFLGECYAAPTSPALAGARAPPSKGEFCFAGPIRYYVSKDFEIERGCHAERGNLVQPCSCVSILSIQRVRMSRTSFKLRLISRSPKRRKRTPNDSSRACRSRSASPRKR